MPANILPKKPAAKPAPKAAAKPAPSASCSPSSGKQTTAHKPAR